MFSRFVRYFDEVARRGSLRRAAETLHVSASSIDRQILRIEEELGMPLFERLPQGLKLTAAGELLVHNLRRWRQDMERVKSQIEDLKGLRRGHIVLAIVEGASTEFALRVASDFHREYPGVSYEFVVSGSQQVVQSVLAGAADFGLAVNPPEMPGLRIVETARFRLGAVVPPNHSLAGNVNARLSDCIEHGIVIPDRSLALREVIDRMLAKSSSQPRVVAASNSIMVMKDLVTRGMGIGLMTEMDARREIEARSLVYVPLKDQAIQASVLSLCVAADRQLSLASSGLLQRFGDELKRA